MLNIGDLKLSDTERTFGWVDTLVANINGTKYQPLDYRLQGFLSGDYVVGSKIIYQNQILYYVYCANRPSSNASQLALGFKNKSGYFFIGEGFSDIYSEEPELFSRNIITLDDLKSPNIYNQPPIIYMGKNYNDLTNEQYENFKCWQEYVNKFEKSFSEQNLKLLRKRKQY